MSYKSATFEPEDARTVAMVGHTSTMIVVRNELSAKTLGEFVALMKSLMGRPLPCCTPGPGTIYPLIAGHMNITFQTKNLQVPYQGFGQFLNDIAGGGVDFAVVPIAGPFPGYIDKGMVSALAVLSDKPNLRVPTVPPANSTKGFEDLNVALWSAIHVSAKTTDAVVEQLNKAVLSALTKPETRKTLEATGTTIFEPMTPQQAHA